MPVFVPVFTSSKVSTVLWRSGAVRVAVPTACRKICGSRSRRGNPSPTRAMICTRPVSWQDGRSSSAASSWLRRIVS